jgi:hypothetical protein
MIELSIEWRAGPDLTEDLHFPKWYIAWFIAGMTGLTALLLILNLPRYFQGRGPQSPGENRDTSADHLEGL